jgi:hypothetical protein
MRKSRFNESQRQAIVDAYLKGSKTVGKPSINSISHIRPQFFPAAIDRAGGRSSHCVLHPYS